MNVWNSMVEGSIISHLDSGPESKEQVDALTPEDIAWVDSCLIKEIPDISDGNWNHIKDALLEILDLYPQGFKSSLPVSDNVPEGTNDDINDDMLLYNNVKEPKFLSRDGNDPMNETGIASEDPQNQDSIGTSQSLPLTFSKNSLLSSYIEEDNVPEGTNYDIDIDMLLSNNVEEPTFPSRDSDDFLMNETGITLEDSQNHDDIDTSQFLSLSKNPFLPTYKEEVEGKENIQTGFSHELSEIGSEPPINNIFRVWDLNLPPVEDELVEQLNVALSENPVESAPSMDSNLSVLKDFKEDLLDDLINSISDLSLEQNKY